MNIDFRPLVDQAVHSRALHLVLIDKLTGKMGLSSLIASNEKYLVVPNHAAIGGFIGYIKRAELRPTYQRLLEQQNATASMAEKKIHEIHGEITKLMQAYTQLTEFVNNTVRENHRALSAIDASITNIEECTAVLKENPAAGIAKMKEQIAAMNSSLLQTQESWAGLSRLTQPFSK